MSDVAKSGGVGVSGLLGVAFIVLKLTHVIDWSWWWVTAPFWIPLAFALVVMGFMLLVTLVMGLVALRGGAKITLRRRR